jgi:hypothetical protein
MERSFREVAHPFSHIAPIKTSSNRIEYAPNRFQVVYEGE